jgi:CRP-like cAMP-binding protein
MSDQGILQTLADYPFARQLTAQQVSALAAGARPLRLEPGEVLARDGDTAVAFCLISSGCVALSADGGRRGRSVVQRVGPGETLGWSWLIPPHVWQFDACAEDEVHGYCFDGAWLRELCARDQHLAHALLQYVAAALASRLAATRRTFAGCAW